MFRKLMSFALLFFSALPVTGAPCFAQPAASPQRTDVPVKTVMLFSSGVGYFEHAGTVHGNSATELRFKTSQINDILKSLVLQDANGGKVSAITYGSQDPLAKTLRSFQVDITGNPSLADLLNQLRGARVTLVHGSEQTSGSILGVENRRKATTASQPVDVSVLNVLSGASIRSIELPSISSLTLDDKELQEELTRALSAFGQARDQDKKPVTINFVGTGDRKVRVGYVVDTPVWKTSYRLLLGDKTSNIQGWAIVENQTESDWNDVSLSLVSGRPISFMMDLYQPLYIARPVVTQELFAGLRPQLYDSGILERDRVAMVADSVDFDEKDYNGKGVSGGGRADARGVGNGPLPSRNPTQAAINRLTAIDLSPPVTEDMTSSVHSVASAARMGELFQYAISNVTLARHKSAMLPIVTDSIGIERVSIYNAQVLATNPLYGVRLNNTTGKHLLQGPVTVLDNDHYAGDARIDNVPPGQQRLLSYGVDLEVRVDNTKSSFRSDVTTVKIAKGVLRVQRKMSSTMEYDVDNRSDRSRTMVIEHPVRAEWKLTGTEKPVETTQSLYRFQSVALPKKITTLTVREEYVAFEEYKMLSLDTPTLTVYSTGAGVSTQLRAVFERLIGMKTSVSETQRGIDATRQQIAAISAEQTRIRENMKTVGQSTDYYKRLLTKLNDQESMIERLQGDTKQLEARALTQRNELEEYVRSLNVD